MGYGSVWGAKRPKIKRYNICHLLSPNKILHWDTSVTLKIHSTNYSSAEMCAARFYGVLLAMFTAHLKHNVSALLLLLLLFLSSLLLSHSSQQRRISAGPCTWSLNREEMRVPHHWGSRNSCQAPPSFSALLFPTKAPLSSALNTRRQQINYLKHLLLVVRLYI